MSIVLITGSMFSEKTTTLLSYARKYRLAKKKVTLIKHAADVRYAAGCISSHNEDFIESTFNTGALSDLKDAPEILKGDVILIDEGQFFPDLAETCAYWADRGKQIIISALNGTFERKPFPAISALIPHVDRIIHLSAVCTLCGEDAHFSYLKLNQLPSEETLIGGADQYEARCRTCLPQRAGTAGLNARQWV